MRLTRREKNAAAITSLFLVIALTMGPDRFNLPTLSLWLLVIALIVYYVRTDPERRS